MYTTGGMNSGVFSLVVNVVFYLIMHTGSKEQSLMFRFDFFFKQ